MTWQEFIGVGDTSGEDEAASAVQQPNAEDDVEDGENSQENSKNGKN